MLQHLRVGALSFGRMSPTGTQSDCMLKRRSINPSIRTNLLAPRPPFLFYTASMATLRTLGFCAAVAAGILFGVSAQAEDGTLVVHVMDIHARPVVGVALRAGSGSSVARVDSFGQARIRLAPNTRPGDIVFLELLAPQSDLVFISPLIRWTAVHSFDEKPANFVEA